MYCPNCGTKCEDSYHYCFRCGFRLPELTAEPEAAETALSEPQTQAAEPVIAEAPAQAETPEEERPEQVSPVSEPICAEPEELTQTPEPVPIAAAQIPVSPYPRKGRIWPPLVAMALLMCLGVFLFCFGPKAQQKPTEYLTITDGVVTFHPESYTGGPELTIPAEINGQTVTAIAPGAFRNCSLESVILPQTVREIGDEAFANCDALRGIYIPGSVTKIGSAAFSDSDALEAIYMPGTLEAIGEDALSGCDSLKFIVFSGTYDQWAELYDGKFASRVELHATDGTYYTHP